MAPADMMGSGLGRTESRQASRLRPDAGLRESLSSAPQDELGARPPLAGPMARHAL